jgi:hypothetical protein
MIPFSSFLRGALLGGVIMTMARAQDGIPDGPTEFDRPVRPLTYEFTFAHMPWKTSGPFTGWTKNFRKNPIPYRMDVTAVTFSRPLGSTRPFWRNVEFLRSVVWSSITRGPENHWGGAALGYRYSRALPGIPHTALFASFQGGVGAIDASGQRYAQARDLTFIYLAATGIRTRLNESWGAHLQVLGQHISNGWQTRPSEGIDCSGLSFSVTYRPARKR